MVRPAAVAGAASRPTREDTMKTGSPLVALNLPRIVALLIVYGRHVVEMMTKNAAQLPGPDPTLATVSQHLDDLESSEAGAQARAKGAVAVRDEKRKQVVDDMKQLRGFVQSQAIKSPTTALSLILSAGMSVRGFTRPHKPTLQARMSGAQRVTLRAKAVKGRAAYEWQSSSDGGKSWATAGITTEATTIVSGLTVGVTALFRFRTTQKRVTTDWSDSVSLLVH
jgi:hypothetical protein